MGLPIQLGLLRSLAFGVALCYALPAASAAPSRRHKASRASAKPAAKGARADSVPAPVTLEPSAGEPTPRLASASAPVLAPVTAPVLPPSPPPVTAPAPAAGEPAAPLVSTHSSASSARSADLGSSGEASRASNFDAESEALGRREAARLAAGRVAVAVWASVDLGRRHFTYSDPVGALLAPYQLPIAPMLSFGLEAYPFASTGLSVLRDLGFRGRISRAFAVDSTTPDGDTIDTSWTRFGGELRQRLLIAGQHPLELGLNAGLDASYFEMRTNSALKALLPSARTISWRLGIDAHWHAYRGFSLLLGGAYLAPSSVGEIYGQFREPRVAGVDTDFGCGLDVGSELEVRLSARYTRYFASFTPVPGDRVVAGGALDEQMQFGLGVRYAH